MTYRTMQDSTAVPNLTVADAYGGYVNGRYTTWLALQERFPGRLLLSIAISSKDAQGHWVLAQCLDVERFDATPDEAPSWCQAMRWIGVKPWVYCSLSSWADVRRAFRAAGVPEPFYFIADYVAHVPTAIPAEWLAQGCVAWQYQSNTQQNIDYTLLIDNVPGFDRAPPLEVAMQITPMPDGSKWLATATPNNHLVVWILPSGASAADGHAWEVLDLTAEMANAFPKAEPFLVQA